MITMYGIKNCDTIKKARRWLEENGVEYNFHDYKTDGLDVGQLDGWLDELGFETLLNKRGTTFRKLPDEIKQNVDQSVARRVMLENPSIIRRPLLDTGSERLVGFDADEYASLFS
jgi:Spx/MgsR family transcriptional regulator